MRIGLHNCEVITKVLTSALMHPSTPPTKEEVGPARNDKCIPAARARASHCLPGSLAHWRFANYKRSKQDWTG